MLTTSQIMCHLLGYYAFQSDWMLSNRGKNTGAALASTLVLATPYLLVTLDPLKLALIAVAHFVIVRFRFARVVCWLRNYMAPKVTSYPITPGSSHRSKVSWHHAWSDYAETGAFRGNPPWVSFFAVAVVDSTFMLSIVGAIG